LEVLLVGQDPPVDGVGDAALQASAGFLDGLVFSGVPPTFRTVEPIGSIPERRAVGGEKVSEILA
jgi:hypothetical protein